MAPGTCPKCGGPNPLEATLCQWCGVGLPHLLPGPPSWPYRPLSPPPLPLSRRFPGAVLAVVVLFAVVGVGVALVLATAPSVSPPTPSAPVHVTQILARSPDYACGLNGVTEEGFSGRGEAFQSVVVVVPASDSVSLPGTVSSITTSTPGFHVLASLPFTATAPMTFLSFSVETPASYDGVPNLTFT